MEAALPKTTDRDRRKWFLWMTAILLCLCATGYGYWKTHPAAKHSSSITPEQLYYERMVYAVNEMHNQVENYAALRKQGTLPAARLGEGKTYVQSLMRALTSPPEELAVAQTIADQLYASYQRYVNDLVNGSASLDNSLAQAESDYERFRQNAAIIKLLSSYRGVNIDCH
jgi:hypothetical protein